MKGGICFVYSRQCHYSGGLHVSLHKQLYGIVSGVAAADLRAWGLDGLLPEWLRSVEVEVEINREARACEETGRLRELGARRRRLVGYLFGVVRTEVRYGFSDERMAAGARLWLLARAYRGLAREAYKEQMMHVRGLLVDLDKVQSAADVELLGLRDCVEELRGVNVEFGAVMDGRTARRARRVLPLSRVQRRVSDGVLGEVMERIVASHVLSADEEVRRRLEVLAERMNVCIGEHRARYNQAVAARRRGDGEDVAPQQKD